MRICFHVTVLANRNGTSILFHLLCAIARRAQKVAGIQGAAFRSTRFVRRQTNPTHGFSFHPIK
jgi:hypothetical protein